MLFLRLKTDVNVGLSTEEANASNARLGLNKLTPPDTVPGYFHIHMYLSAKKPGSKKSKKIR
jgi:hypothetical protein